MKNNALHTDWLIAFRAVAQTLSVSVASRALELDKSQISKRIASLEHKLGATLFTRSTRKIALTPAGLANLEHVQRALSELDAGHERIRSQRTELSGLVRLTAPVSWGQRVLGPCLSKFLSLHPGVQIELILTDQKMDLAREHVDLALRWTAKPNEELSCVQLMPICWHVVASRAYLTAHGTPTDPADLSDHQCLCYWRESSDERWEFEHIKSSQRSSVQAHGRYHVNNPEAVADAALLGLGIALLPDYLCSSALASQQLIRVLPNYLPVTKFGTHIVAQSTTERLLLRRNQALLMYLQNEFSLRTEKENGKPVR